MKFNTLKLASSQPPPTWLQNIPSLEGGLQWRTASCTCPGLALSEPPSLQVCLPWTVHTGCRRGLCGPPSTDCRSGGPSVSQHTRTSHPRSTHMLHNRQFTCRLHVHASHSHHTHTSHMSHSPFTHTLHTRHMHVSPTCHTHTSCAHFTRTLHMHASHTSHTCFTHTLHSSGQGTPPAWAPRFAGLVC